MKETCIDRLMARNKVPWKWGAKLVVLKPEEKLSIELADRLRVLTVSGHLKACWMHIPNESKRGILTALILIAMGLIKGAPDYVFLYRMGSAVIELKAGKGRPSANQADFKLWCEQNSVLHAYCYSAEEALEKLREWEILE